MDSIKILKFERNLHNALWGSESWEVSAHSAGPSVIADGPFAGKVLTDVASDFPLLVKVIDARERLSVQVHPNENTCKVTGGDPKTEMWCMLEDGFIYAGLKPGVGDAEVRAAVESGRFEELLVRHDAKAGDVFFIPGGLVHAIGDGAKIYEVQQSSNTTFRLYDWNRVGKDGRKRELHVDASLKAIDFSLPVPVASEGVKCPFFNFRKLSVKGVCNVRTSGGFAVFFAMRGTLRVNGVELAEGASALALGDGEIKVESSDSLVLVTTL